MGKLLSYSGISTKIRAMQSKLITEDQIQEMLQFTSTSHAAAWLKRTPEYSKTWASLDENSLHRGQIEKLLKASIFNDLSVCKLRTAKIPRSVFQTIRNPCSQRAHDQLV